MTLDDLVAHAESLGLHVVWRNLGRRSGELTRSGLIVINDRKSDLTQRVTIAHECGHHVNGHDWTREHDRERDERQADLYAANLLINPWKAEQAGGYCTSAGEMARELGVTSRLLELWMAQPWEKRRGRRCGLVAG